MKLSISYAIYHFYYQTIKLSKRLYKKNVVRTPEPPPVVHNGPVVLVVEREAPEAEVWMEVADAAPHLPPSPGAALYA